jgi:hypothetical protein
MWNRHRQSLHASFFALLQLRRQLFFSNVQDDVLTLAAGNFESGPKDVRGFSVRDILTDQPEVI